MSSDEQLRVKKVEGLSDSGLPYYRGRCGPLVLFQPNAYGPHRWRGVPGEWCACSKDGEPSHALSATVVVEEVKV